MIRMLFPILLILLASLPLIADDPRDYMKSQTRYWGIEQTIKSQDFDRLVELKRKADQPGLNPEQRKQAYTDLFEFTQELRGYPKGRVPAERALMYWSPGHSPIFPPLQPARPGELGNYTKRGGGPIPMILIPDLGADATVFDEFMKRNDSRFTFYAVTLPGFGSTNPPARPAKLDFGKMEWWNNAMNAILRLIKSEKMNRPVILGHQAGAYLAMKLALQHTDVVRGGIVLNGLLYAPMPAIPENASIDERIRIVNSLTPVEIFPNPSKEKYLASIMQLAPWFCKNPQRQKFFADLLTQSPPTTWWNYFAELLTTDLRGEIKGLKVPLLVLPSIYDSKEFAGSEMAIQQWAALDRSKSSLPITVIGLENCRAYATEDQPQKLDEAVLKWTAQL